VEANLPDSYQFAVQQAEVTLENSLDTPLRIDAVGDDRQLVKLIAPLTIPPHAHGAVQLSLDVPNDLGIKVYRAELLGSGGKPAATAILHTFVQSAFDPDRPVINFAVVARGVTAQKTIVLSTLEAANFNLSKIIEAPSWLDAEIGPDRKSVTAKLKQERPLGLVDGFIKVETDLKRQQQVWILAKMDSRGLVVPNQNPVDFARVRQGLGGEQTVRLEETSQRPFTVEGVSIEGTQIAASVEPCVPDLVWCKGLRLSVDKNIPTGQIFGRAHVRIAGQKTDLPIELRGLVIPANLKIIDLNDPAQAAAYAPSSAPAKVDTELQKAVAKASRSKGEATANAEAKTGCTLHWVLEKDSGVYGYAVYRSDSESGPFIRVNSDLVKSDSTGEGGKYAWHDGTAVTGHTYWYYIGMVLQNGTKSQLTGPQKAVAK
jgi:hypothetical protein